MMINCAIIDDEYLAREYLKDYVGKISYLNLVGSYESPLLALEQIKTGKIDLLFLDIRMPDISGLDFLKSLDKRPYVIITTAYKEFAIEGYELNVIDYLLKPFPLTRFLKAADKVAELIRGDTKIEPATNIKNSGNEYIVVRADRKLYKINYEDLIYLEGQKAYVSFYTTTSRITALMTLKELENILPAKQFVRIHKSFIVSLKKINTLDGNTLGVGEYKLPIGKSYKSAIEEVFKLN